MKIMDHAAMIAEVEKDMHEALAELGETYSSSDSEWEGVYEWDTVCTLPRGVKLDGLASSLLRDAVLEELTCQAALGGAHPNGVPYFCYDYTDKWNVQYQCECALVECSEHLFPCTMRFEGDMGHMGRRLDDEFVKKPPMTLSQARDWWAERTGSFTTTVTMKSVSRVLYRNWSDICSFPPGKELPGQVAKGRELEVLHKHFGAKYENGVPKFRILNLTVHVQCRCGKIKCEKCIFPATVKYDKHFDLVVHLRSETIPIGDNFRLLDPMPIAEALKWFENKPLLYRVRVKPGVIQFKMLCKCGKALDQVPCDKCRMKLMKNCSKCHASVRKRSLTAGLCQNCRHKEIIFCPHCEKNVPRGHRDCEPLLDSHFAQETTGIYPPMMRKKNSKYGVCLDCGECMHYNVYHRHQYRRHYGVAPSPGLSREYKSHECPYCNFSTYDKSQLTVHIKSHINVKQHVCRHNCGASFTTHTAEIIHCQSRHDGVGIHQSSSMGSRRVGLHIERVSKKAKKQ